MTAAQRARDSLTKPTIFSVSAPRVRSNQLHGACVHAICHANCRSPRSTQHLRIAAVSTTPSPSPTPAVDPKARRRLKRHFWQGHWNLIPEILMMSGVLVFVLGLHELDHFLLVTLLGAALFAGGAGVRKWRQVYVGSGAEFDSIAEADYQGMQAVALARFGLTPADLRDPEPCKFRVPVIPRDIGAVFSGSRQGGDGKLRRTPQEFVVINFGHSLMYVFRCLWDLSTGASVYEELHEFAYQDVLSVDLTHKKQRIRINLNTRALLAGWKKQGFEPVNNDLLVPTEETLSLRLAHGEVQAMFSWVRMGADGVPNGGGYACFQTAQRLQKLVRELKAEAAAPAREAAPKAETPKSTPSTSTTPAAAPLAAEEKKPAVVAAPKPAAPTADAQQIRATPKPAMLKLPAAPVAEAQVRVTPRPAAPAVSARDVQVRVTPKPAAPLRQAQTPMASKPAVPAVGGRTPAAPRPVPAAPRPTAPAVGGQTRLPASPISPVSPSPAAPPAAVPTPAARRSAANPVATRPATPKAAVPNKATDPTPKVLQEVRHIRRPS